MAGAPKTDVMLVVMGPPHSGELTTSVLRLTHALLAQGATVQVWACGYSTMLSQQAMGETKPINLLDRHAEYPTTVALIRSLHEAFPGRLWWFGCRACSEHRGATGHIPEVVMRAPSTFGKHVAAATKTVFMGVA
ncbi:hypothetical protein LRS74_18505 [Streptomyces sp. LX-29]|uniref:hypothetical protein n=1 Tax=unclassified Streptomyces TaxID=2593676 RepID=UPI001185645B|nr:MULTISPECIES: hypothetical protein [unclassified Streptomyces]TVL88960.1 hypothetical protein CD790_29300 [Streptomyces sp. SAJ15]WFB08811.1 hypothetical protein LRS74_18505 [Streptomyces sp. LX-29]